MKAVLLQHKPGKFYRTEGVGRLTVHLCDFGRCSDHLIFGFKLVQFEVKPGCSAILNDADLV